VIVGAQLCLLRRRERRLNRLLGQARDELRRAGSLSDQEWHAREMAAVAKALSDAGLAHPRISRPGRLSTQEDEEAYCALEARELDAAPEFIDRPAWVGIKYSIPAVLVSLLVGGAAAFSMREINRTAWLVAGGLSAVLVPMAFGYSFIAWKCGKALARYVFTMAFCAVLLVGCFVLIVFSRPG